MTTVQQILDKKGRDVFTIGPDQPVIDAIRVMAEKDIGALIVSDGGRSIGMFSERDYARNVFLKGKASPTTLIREVMSTPLIHTGRDQTVEQCMMVMTSRRIRHLPVLEEGRLVGVVSIGDLVNSIIEAQSALIEQLESYIHN